MTKQCTLLYQATNYNSSQTNLVIPHDVIALLRYDIHLARIGKTLCDKVHDLPNLARGGVASQSSEYNVSLPSASLAIDGLPGHNFAQGSCSSTAINESNSWWMLDMQQVFDVDIVRISNRIWNFTRLSHFEIRIGMNSTDFSQNTLCYKMTGIARRSETMNYPCLNTTRGRYLSIQRYFQNPDWKGIQICEVQVVPPLSDTSHFNIAPYVTATQSSVKNAGYPSRAIDGFAIPDWHTGYSCTQNEYETDTIPGWWLLDLGQNISVSLVRITNRNVASGRLYNFDIRVGFDPDFLQNPLCYYMPGTVGMGATEDFPCIKPTWGRYLSIQRIYPLVPPGTPGMGDSVLLQLCEVQVFQTGC